MPEEQSGNMPDLFDRMLGQLDGLPDVTKTRMTPLRVIPPLGIGGSQSFSVQTYRQREVGDWIFLERGTQEGLTRLIIPPDVSAAIARQRDQLAKMVRSKVARAAAHDRMKRGIKPAFLNSKRKRRKK